MDAFYFKDAAQRRGSPSAKAGLRSCAGQWKGSKPPTPHKAV